MTASVSTPIAHHPAVNLATTPHPLAQLSATETTAARETILSASDKSVTIQFRSISLQEPPKHELVPFLEAEHRGEHVKRLQRLARVQYDVIGSDKSHEYTESIVDVESKEEVVKRVVDKVHHAALTT